jgi:hypothetical protein
MGIRELPAEYADFERYNIEYEKRHFRYTQANHRVGTATLEMFASWFPRVLRPIVRRAIYAIMDDPVIAGFGFPQPAPAMRKLVDATLRARAWVLRLMPARRQPRLRTEMRHRSYPHGYRIEELGPSVEQEPGLTLRS